MIRDRSHHAEHFYPCQNLAKPKGFGDICEKLLSDPYVLFLVNGGHVFQRIKNPHISSMQNTPRNIYIEFGSNQSSSFREEEFCTIVHKDDNDDGREVMANSPHGLWPGELKKLQGNIHMVNKIL